MRAKKPNPAVRPIAKSPTGIRGFDDITGGGLPRGRTTLVYGAAGCGKTLFAMEYLFRGITEFGEPGVLMAFEETKEKLHANAASLGFNLEQLAARKKLVIDYVHVDRSEIEETGEYDLGGLFARLDHHVKTVGAKRVALDTLEVLFGGLKNQGIIRSELRRLFGWLENRHLSAVVTAERGEGFLTRHGLEEFVSDCVILLDNRVSEELATRRLRIVKYRGSGHGTNEYPFLIDEQGISVFPVTSLGLTHEAPSRRVSAGIPELDQMLGGKGYFQGSSILVSGTAGTGKSSLAASFTAARCARGEPTLYFSLEESPKQILRNMKSIGIDLEPYVRRGTLNLQSSRPSVYGLEMHLVHLHKLIEDMGAKAVVIDPITSLLLAGNPAETRSLLVRLIDVLKTRNITALMTSLTSDGNWIESTDVGISSLIDTWITLDNVKAGGERNRILQIVKSRGMNHSNQLREFTLSGRGVGLKDVYLGSQGVLTGSARLAQEGRDRDEEAARRIDAERRDSALQVEEKTLRARIHEIENQLRGIGSDRERLARMDREREARIADEARRMSLSRRVSTPATGRGFQKGRS
jgi:circadian clock protein KaiC